jgi:hypothetical protein
MSECVPDETVLEPATTTTREVERKYVITPPKVKQSASVRVIDIIRTDANGKRSVTEVHLLGELLAD